MKYIKELLAFVFIFKKNKNKKHFFLKKLNMDFVCMLIFVKLLPLLDVVTQNSRAGKDL